MMLARFAFMIRPYRLRREFLVTRSTMPMRRRREREWEPGAAVRAGAMITRAPAGWRWHSNRWVPGAGRSNRSGLWALWPIGAEVLVEYTVALYTAMLHSVA